MRIGVDCHVLSGIHQGSKTYLSNLYKYILSNHPMHEFVFFGHWEENFFGDNYSHVDYKSNSRWKRLTYQTWPLAKHHGLDLLHTNYIAPLFLPCRSLVTIHDVLFETHPQYFDKHDIVRNRILVKRSIKKAALIHTISEYSRNMLVAIYKVPKELVHVVPVGVDTTRYTTGNSPVGVSQVERIYNIKDYILTVGRLEPRKNHIGLIQAYALAREMDKNLGKLVIVGQKDFGYIKIFETIDRLHMQDHVRILESVSDEFLPNIYRHARLFVYPTFAEGFGIPPLEAMASGVPVIASNTTALPEVLGDAALLFNPNDVQKIADLMLSILSDGTLASKLVHKGHAQANKWSWNSAAIQYLKSIDDLK